jgi:hypothetical protein
VVNIEEETYDILESREVNVLFTEEYRSNKLCDTA